MNIRSNKKYLLLIPLVVSLVMLTFFSAAYDEIVREKHEQKYLTAQKALNFCLSVVDYVVAADDDWETYDYGTMLTSVFKELDEVSSIHVLLLSQDFTPISGSFVDDIKTSFDLLSCDEFLMAVHADNDSGELTVVIDENGKPPYEILIYFKKIPTGDYDNKLIAVFGVSRYAIEDNFAAWLVWGVAGLVAMTVVLQIWMILYISKLADAERSARMRGEAGENHGMERFA